MQRESNYSITLSTRIDLNLDQLLKELQDILHKSGTQLIRMILVDFFDRNDELLNQYYKKEIDKEELSKTFLRNYSDDIKSDVINYFKQKHNEKA